MKIKLNFKGEILIQAALVGLVAGFFVVLFKISITNLFNSIQFNIKEKIFLLPVICALGGLISGYLVDKFAPETKGSGIPYVKATLAHLGNLTRVRSIFVKFFGGIASIGCGMSLGREGPSVQLGAGAGALIGKIFKLNGSNKDKLISAGAGSAIAATFNAPIAGCIFVLEELLQKFNSSTLFPVLIATVCACAIARNILGNDVSFLIPNIENDFKINFLACIITGIFCGILGVLFSKLIHFNNYLFSKIKIKSYFKPAICGFIVGLVGIFLPLIMGSGNTGVNVLLQGKLGIVLIISIFIFKFLITPLCFGSGAVGGIFLPTLMLGAYLGYIIGYFSTQFGFDVNLTAASLIGMAGFLSSVARTPICATVMVFEMTGRYDLILYIMLVCAISDIVAQNLNHISIYSELILKQIKNSPEIKILKTKHVKDIFQKEVFTLDYDFSLDFAQKTIQNINHNLFPVKNNENKALGTITKSAIEDSLINSNNKNLKVIDIMNTNILKVYQELDLYSLLLKFHFNEQNKAVVLNSKDEIIGIVTRYDIQKIL